MLNRLKPRTESMGESAARTDHIGSLDGLRGIAILMVLAIHLYPQTYLKDVCPTLVPFADRILLLGQYGVQLFFVLSGFLITGILLDSRGEKRFFVKFYMRRALRIFPLYYGSLVALLIVLPHFVEFDAGAQAIAGRQLFLWTYLSNWPQNWVWDGSNLFKLGHFWSLCVEEHFYLVWPAVVALLTNRRLFCISFLLVLVALLADRLSGYGLLDLPILHWTTLRRVDGLAVGAMISIAMRESSLGRYLLPGRRLYVCFTVLATLMLLYYFLPHRFHRGTIEFGFNSALVWLFGMLLLMALRSQPGDSWYRVLNSSTLVSFGKYSYGLYVIHGILRPVFSGMIEQALPRDSNWPLAYCGAYYGLTICISFGLAYLSFHIIEKRFLKLKRYFEYTSKRNGPVARLGLPGSGLKSDETLSSRATVGAKIGL